ncbi:MAG TPA: site-2 protease family protein [Gemmatales bacterium]|nr:site-2 protease family protein [Gemmatales bacterium]
MEAENVTTDAPAKKSGLPITELLVAVAIGAAIYVGVLKGKGFEEGLRSLLSIGMAIVGIGLLIFIHELGHFLAAKWCGVKVEAFALGIGPLIPALSFKRGETSYGIAWFPIGGYVKMLGQVDDPNDKSQDAKEVSESPHSYKNKTVGQRMLIISAGVIMNVLLGFVLFIIVYFFGKDEVVGKIGTISPGSPAERAGLQSGSELLQVSNINNPWYNDLNMSSALSRAGSTEIPIKFRTRDGQERAVIVIPKKDKNDSRPTVGVTDPRGTRLHRFAPKGQSPANPWHPAGKAAFLPSDIIVSIQPEGITEATPVKDGFDIHLAEHIFRDKKLKYQVKRAGAKPDETTLLMVEVEPSQFRTLGLRMTMGPIVSLSEYRPAITKELQAGDLIVAVNGKTDFDPMQLPDLVDRMARLGKPVILQFKREEKTFDITVTRNEVDQRGTWMESSPNANAPMAFPALGFSYSVGNVIASVTPGSPAHKAGIKAGETIKQVAYENKDPEFKDKLELGEKYGWPFAFEWMQDLPPKTLYTLTIVDAAGTERSVENLQTVPDPNWFFYTRGLKLEPETRLRIADNIWDAIVIGGRESYRFVGRIYLNLYSLIRGDISVKLLNGPLGLAEMTYRVANIGLIDLLHLLAIISINLAIVNFLPIPVLDGGHMVLLIAEKIRGKPLNETWVAVITYIGLAIVLSLMLATVFLDFTKYAWFQKLFGW